MEIATVLCAALILAVGLHTIRGGRSWLESKLMIRLGDWSYAFYLVHATILYGAINLVGHATNAAEGILGALVIFVGALLTSCLLHRLVEAPAERAIRGWKDRNMARRAAAR